MAKLTYKQARQAKLTEWEDQIQFHERGGIYQVHQDGTCHHIYDIEKGWTTAINRLPVTFQFKHNDRDYIAKLPDAKVRGKWLSVGMLAGAVAMAAILLLAGCGSSGSSGGSSASVAPLTSFGMPVGPHTYVHDADSDFEFTINADFASDDPSDFIRHNDGGNHHTPITIDADTGKFVAYDGLGPTIDGQFADTAVSGTYKAVSSTVIENFSGAVQQPQE